MRIKLTPDKGLRVEKARLNDVPTLILRPANREPANIGLMWIHGGGNMGGMMEMLGGFSVLRLSSMMGMMDISFTKEELLKMHKQLTRIKKPKNK